MLDKRQNDVPEQVMDVLKTSNIGYLSVTSPKGELFSYPVAFYFSHFKLYFVTPIGAAKLRFIRANPSISFLVDNHLLTKGATGVMIQGKARVFSVAKTILSILSVGPNIARFSKKYPGMFTFYAKGKELPDERKLHKYRLIRLDPKKMLYWVGYEFGKYVPDGSPSEDPLAESRDEEKLETLAKLMASLDEELPTGKIPQSGEWLEGLEEATSRGVVSRDERSAIDSYRRFVQAAADSSKVGTSVTNEEKQLLKKWRESSGGPRG
ncbi:MAG: pyridoxamine 5'-phosphate oxidase family protein [Thaumarchaeota archaeon]|nr:pyridoxamine 5'-phosphate oxidase family protein [Nitrososphaerota archaeon]